MGHEGKCWKVSASAVDTVRQLSPIIAPSFVHEFFYDVHIIGHNRLFFNVCTYNNCPVEFLFCLDRISLQTGKSCLVCKQTAIQNVMTNEKQMK